MIHVTICDLLTPHSQTGCGGGQQQPEGGHLAVPVGAVEPGQDLETRQEVSQVRHPAPAHCGGRHGKHTETLHLSGLRFYVHVSDLSPSPSPRRT